MIFSDNSGQFTHDVWEGFQHHNGIYKDKFGEWPKEDYAIERISAPSDVYVFCLNCGSRDIQFNGYANRQTRKAGCDCGKGEFGFFVNEDKWRVE